MPNYVLFFFKRVSNNITCSAKVIISAEFFVGFVTDFVTKLKSSLLRGDKPFFTVSPGSKMDSDITRSFVTDIAFSIFVNFADECAEEEDVESSWIVGGKVLCIVGDAELSLALQFPNLPLQKTLLLRPTLGR